MPLVLAQRAAQLEDALASCDLRSRIQLVARRLANPFLGKSTFFKDNLFTLSLSQLI